MNAQLQAVSTETGEIVPALLLANIPADPSAWPAARLIAACDGVYELRYVLVKSPPPVADAYEAMRRTAAIREYVTDREQKASANRALRVLEMAVGKASGSADENVGGRGHKALITINGFEGASGRVLIHNLRTLAEHSDLVLPALEETPHASRRDLLNRIDRAKRDADGSFEVSRECCTTQDLHSLVARVDSGEVAPFGTIYADPPWQYGNQGTRASNDKHYGGESVDWLCDPANMPIARLAAPESHLHLWTTNAFLFDAQRILEAWGYTYKSCFVWVKPQMGMGNYWRVSHEFLLLGTRGGLGFPVHDIMSWARLDRTQHSAKPEEIRDLIHKVSPGPQRLELFARRAVPGWWCWGNEVDRDIFAQGSAR